MLCGDLSFRRIFAEPLTRIAVVLALAHAVAGPAAAADSSINLALVPSRLSGVAPLAIFFNAAGTTSSAPGARPFHDIEYRWDFGDPGSGSWSNTPGMPNLSRNAAKGPIAAHVYEKPGRYTVTVSAIDGSNAPASTRVQISVDDPDAVFAGANTICFSTSGNFGGCPAAASRVTNSTYENVVSFAAAGKRLLLRRGESWTAGSISPIANAGPGILGAFGPDTAPPVILATSNNGGIRLAAPGTALVDWRVMDLELNGNGNMLAAGFSVPGGATPPGGFFIRQTTLLRLNIHGFNYGISLPDPAGPYDQIFVVDSNIFGALSTRASGGYNAYITGSNFAFLGNSSIANGANSNHNMRNPHIRTGVISHNHLTGSPTWASGGQTLKIHAQKSSTGKFTEKLLISDNIVDGISGIAPQNGVFEERLRDVIIERNWIRGLTYMSGSGFTIRNNICDRSGDPGNAICFKVWRQGAEPVPDRFAFYNNTGFSSAASTAFRVVQVGDSGARDATNVTLKNNLGYAPNVINPGAQVLLRDLSGGGATASNNSSNAQVKSVSPKFLGPLSTPSGFKVEAGSYAKNAAAPFPIGPPVFSDFFGNERSTGAATDIGAAAN